MSWLAPGGLVILAAVSAGHVLSSAALTGLGSGYPYAVFLGGAFLAWRFHRSRVVAGLLALALSTWVVAAAGSSLPAIATAFAATLLPILLASLTLARDRGIATPRGLFQIGAVLVLPAIALIGVKTWGADLVNVLLAPAPTSLPAWLSPLTGPALAAFAVCVGVTVAVAARRGGAVEKGMVWASVAGLASFAALPDMPAASLYSGAAGLILALSVIEGSYRMAYRDELTGLPARRALPEALTTLGGRYSIAMVDVDHFKRFNDRHGHDVGDQVLRMVAIRLARVGGGGRPFRYGGEEFAILFPGKGREQVAEHLETLRFSVESAEFTLRGRRRQRKRTANGGRKKKRGNGKRRRKLSVTVSIGVAERSERHPRPDQVLRAADRALYRAKRAGRNRIGR